MAARRGGVNAAPTPLLAQKGRTSRVTKNGQNVIYVNVTVSIDLASGTRMNAYGLRSGFDLAKKKFNNDIVEIDRPLY